MLVLNLIFINLVAYVQVDVEQLFSCGWLALSHIRSRLSAQSTRAVICLGIWSTLESVHVDNIKSVTSLPEIEDGKKEEMDAVFF